MTEKSDIDLSCKLRALPPFRPQTMIESEEIGIRVGGVLLVLDNGVRIESRSVDSNRVAGDYVMVVDKYGYEIGYWDNKEWQESPVEVMGAILVCAAQGTSARSPTNHESDLVKKAESERNQLMGKLLSEGASHEAEIRKLKGLVRKLLEADMERLDFDPMYTEARLMGIEIANNGDEKNRDIDGE